MSKVLITGASGFIAPHLIEECLNEGWQVWGVDRASGCKIKHPNFKFGQKDVRDITLEELKGADYIFHLAFVTNIPNSIQHPLETTYDNIGMTVYLLDLAAKAGVKKFVFPSTASLYGTNPIPWKEDMPPYPLEPYSWQKLACEYACKIWTSRYGLPTTVLRLFQVFGENQRQDSALYAFFKAKKENKPMTLTETTAQSSFRTGQRDFVYVKDVARAFVLAAKTSSTGKGEIINIGTGRVNTIEEVAKAIGGEIIFIPRRGYEVEKHEADITQAKKLLNWEPKVNILDWLREFVKTI